MWRWYKVKHRNTFASILVVQVSVCHLHSSVFLFLMLNLYLPSSCFLDIALPWTDTETHTNQSPVPVRIFLLSLVIFCLFLNGSGTSSSYFESTKVVFFYLQVFATVQQNGVNITVTFLLCGLHRANINYGKWTFGCKDLLLPTPRQWLRLFL